MIKLFTLYNQQKWDKIVRSFKNHDVYYLSGYVKSFHVHGDGTPILLYHTNDKGGRAICVLMIRDVATAPLFKENIPKEKFFDTVTPYGYGGFIFEGNVDLKELSTEFRKVLQERNVNSVFFRFHPVLDNAKDNVDVVNVIPLGKTIALDLSSPDIIWENITSKNRNMIRKAEKSGVEINHSSDPKLFKAFKEIYDGTMREDCAEEYYFFGERFYESIAEDLKGHYEIFYATHEDKIISIAIMIFANDQMHYHLSGSLREYRSFAPSNLLLYKAALWGQEQGYRTFHLGGGVGSGEDPLYKFKAAFNRNSDNRFAIGKMIVDEEQYNYLVNLRSSLDSDFNSKSSYFPLYRS